MRRATEVLRAFNCILLTAGCSTFESENNRAVLICVTTPESARITLNPVGFAYDPGYSGCAGGDLRGVWEA